MVVTSSDNKILAEEGPARGSSSIQEAFEQEESCRDLQQQSIACAEIQSLLRTPTISAVTSELSGEANRAKYRFAAFNFRMPPFRRSGYSSLEQDVFNKNVLSCEGDQRGEKRKRKPARADMPVYLPGFHFLWWDPGGYNSYILASRYDRRRRKHIAACADLLFFPPGSRYKLWDSGGYDRIFISRGGERVRNNVPACADLSFYPSGPRYKLWDPGGYNSNILDNRVRGGERGNKVQPVWESAVTQTVVRSSVRDSASGLDSSSVSGGGRKRRRKSPACADQLFYRQDLAISCGILVAIILIICH